MLTRMQCGMPVSHTSVCDWWAMPIRVLKKGTGTSRRSETFGNFKRTPRAGFASKLRFMDTNSKRKRGNHGKTRLASSLTLRVSVL
jgi:hypothetical protein